MMIAALITACKPQLSLGLRHCLCSTGAALDAYHWAPLLVHMFECDAHCGYEIYEFILMSPFNEPFPFLSWLVCPR